MRLPDLVQPSETIVKPEDVDNFHKNRGHDYGVVNSPKYMDFVKAFAYIITVWGEGTGGLEDG